MAKAQAVWNRGLQFVGTSGSGHSIVIDSGGEGGFDSAPSNTELIAMAQAGCTGMDVVSILKKKRVEFDDFQVDVDITATEEYPRYMKHVHITYKIWGDEISREAVERSVELSLEKYCIVSHTLSGRAEITHEIQINPER